MLFISHAWEKSLGYSLARNSFLSGTGPQPLTPKFSQAPSLEPQLGAGDMSGTRCLTWFLLPSSTMRNYSFEPRHISISNQAWQSIKTRIAHSFIRPLIDLSSCVNGLAEESLHVFCTNFKSPILLSAASTLFAPWFYRNDENSRKAINQWFLSILVRLLGGIECHMLCDWFEADAIRDRSQ